MAVWPLETTPPGRPGRGSHDRLPLLLGDFVLAKVEALRDRHLVLRRFHGEVARVDPHHLQRHSARQLNGEFLVGLGQVSPMTARQ